MGQCTLIKPIPVAALCNEWFWAFRLLWGAGPNLVGSMNVYLL